MPGLKPYRQHEIVAGWDYQINKDWAFEARYDRRRLDHVIEDASLAEPVRAAESLADSHHIRLGATFTF